MTSSQISSAPASVQRRCSPPEEAVRGRHQAHVGGDRLHDHRGQLRAVAVERLVERGLVVVGHDDGVGDGALGDAGGAREPEGGDAAPRRRRAARRRGRGSSRRTSGSSDARWRPGPAAPRSSPPRCPTRPGAPCRPTARARRWLRRARPRVRWARRTTCRRRPPAAPRRPPPGGRGRGSTRPTTARSRRSGGRRCRPGRGRRRRPRRTARRRPTRTSGPVSRRRPGCAPARASNSELTRGVRRRRVRGT